AVLLQLDPVPALRREPRPPVHPGSRPPYARQHPDPDRHLHHDQPAARGLAPALVPARDPRRPLRGGTGRRGGLLRRVGPARSAADHARVGRHLPHLPDLRLERVLLRGQLHVDDRRDVAYLPGRVHQRKGPLLRQALGRSDAGQPAGPAGRLDRAEAAHSGTHHGGREMKAVLIEEPHRVAITTVDDPTPSSAEVVVEVEACGICGTDVHVLEGDFPPTRYPIVPGHEFCGEAVAVGSGVDNVRVGDFVAVDPSLFCGRCYFCQIGRGNLCENWNAVGVGSTFGACAELVRVPSRNVYALPDDLPRRWGALVEPLSCAVRGFDRLDLSLASSYLTYGP